MLTSTSQPSFLRTSVIRGGCDRPDAGSASPIFLPTRIGSVLFTTHRGEAAEAILDAAGTWRCPKLPVLDRVLNALFRLDDPSTGSEPRGHRELVRVAAWIKGQVRIA